MDNFWLNQREARNIKEAKVLGDSDLIRYFLKIPQDDIQRLIARYKAQKLAELRKQ